MSVLQGALLLGLVAVALLHVAHRLLGAVFGIAWCLAALAWGLWSFTRGAEVAFVGIPVQPWAFVLFMTMLAGYNVFVVARLLRRRRASETRAEERASR